MLLAATLPDPVRRELFEAVDALLASLEARHSPLLIDFAETSPRELFAGRRAWLGPCARVARAVTHNDYPLPASAPGGQLGRVVVAGAPDATSVPALGDRDGRDQAAEQRRAAWPWSGSFVVATRSPEHAAKVHAALAPLSVVENGLVGALWSDATARALAASVPTDLLARGERWARRVRTEAPRPDEDEHTRALRELADLFEPMPAEGMLPFWGRTATEVLVLPRRGAIARTTELRAVIGETLRRASVGDGAALRPLFLAVEERPHRFGGVRPNGVPQPVHRAPDDVLRAAVVAVARGGRKRLRRRVATLRREVVVAHRLARREADPRGLVVFAPDENRVRERTAHPTVVRVVEVPLPLGIVDRIERARVDAEAAHDTAPSRQPSAFAIVAPPLIPAMKTREVSTQISFAVAATTSFTNCASFVRPSYV